VSETKPKSATRSPITSRPLRLPGQSVSEERSRILEDKLLLPLLVAVLLFLMAALEWWRYLVPQRPNPWVMSIAALVAIGYLAWQVMRWRPQLKRLRQALDGERVVGEYLERLRADGYQVFHDLVGEGFNVDHVIVGPGGVFTIETKTWSKPVRGEPRMDFDGERVLAAGHEPDRNPVVQAKAQAAWLRRLIEEMTGRRIAVRPVILFPGWFIRPTDGAPRDVWVLEPKALPGFLGHEPARLVPDEVRLIAAQLSRFLRAEELRRS